jgi:hypothetical protein
MEDDMTLAHRRGLLGIVLLLTAAFVVLGCNQNENKGGDKVAEAKTDTTKATDKDADSDHGWWCAEHGIPEEECGLCSKAYRDQRKAEGDWCAEHRRVKSQCFKCDPTLYERVFEPKYMAKYDGKKPPRPPEKEFQK